MAKLSINLLPEEFRIEELKRLKFSKVQTIGIIVIMVMVLTSALTVGLRFLQSQSLTRLQARLAQDEEKVSSLKTTQGSLILLKDRLSTISKYLETPSEGVYLYSLINKLLPSTININSVSIGKDGEILLLAVTQDSEGLEEFFTNLISEDTNEKKISEVGVDNLSRGRDGLYRLNFTIKPKR